MKCEASVKANGLLWRLISRVIKFIIEFPEDFELCDYTGHQQSDDDVKVKEPFSVTVSNKTKKTEIKFKLPDLYDPTDNSGIKETFSVAASNRPKKTEIIFKLPKEKNNIENHALSFSFDLPILKKPYDKTARFDFIPSPAAEAGIENIIVFRNLNIRKNLPHEKRSRHCRRKKY
jgi:hypothetical protein